MISVVETSFATALASIKVINGSNYLNLNEDDYNFLISNQIWVSTERARVRSCVEACVYGALDYLGLSRFPPPAEFVAAAIAYYVHPVNLMIACSVMDGLYSADNVVNQIEEPISAELLFSLVLRIRAHIYNDIYKADYIIDNQAILAGTDESVNTRKRVNRK